MKHIFLPENVAIEEENIYFFKGNIWIEEENGCFSFSVMNESGQSPAFADGLEGG